MHASRTWGFFILISLFIAGCGETEDSPSNNTQKHCDSGTYSAEEMRCVNAMTSATSSSTSSSTSTGTATSSTPLNCTDSTMCPVEMPECLDSEDTSSTSGQCGVPTSCKDVLDSVENEYCDKQLPGTNCLPNTEDKTKFGCFIPVESKYIRIVDTTPMCMEESVNGLGASGADMTFAMLFNKENEVVGLGRLPTLSAYTQGQFKPGYNMAEQVFSGNENPRTARGCPIAFDFLSFRPDAVVSLGCGGSIVLQFLSPKGTEVLMDETHTLFVAEYGPFCEESQEPTAYGTDRYKVELCLTNVGATFGSIDFDTSCSLISGPMETGVSEFELRGIEP